MWPFTSGLFAHTIIETKENKTKNKHLIPGTKKKNPQKASEQNKKARLRQKEEE